jgi:gliding motility-associated-like protein
MKTVVFIAYLICLVLHASKDLNAQVATMLCASQKGIKYQVKGDVGSIFHWTVEGGKIVSDPHAGTITVNWGDKPGEYTISVYEEKITGCLGNTIKTKVGILASPVINLDKIENICEGGQIELNAGTGFSEYLWQDGSTQPVILAKTSGIYWIEVTNQKGCSFRDTIILVVNPLPKIDLGKDTMLCAQGELVLDAGNIGGFCNWSNGANSQTIVAHENDGTIWVHVTDANGCSGSDTIQILKCLEHNDLFIPKAFTPNHGAFDNFWMIGGTEKYPNMSVKIYDRWGILIFESEKGYPKPWDGTSRGRKMPMDAYYYIINCGDGSKEIVGSVTIIR